MWEWILFLRYGWPMTEVKTLFPAGTNVRDSQCWKSLTRCKQDLNLCITWVQTLLNEVKQSSWSCAYCYNTKPRLNVFRVNIAMFLNSFQYFDKIKKTFLTCAKSTLSSHSKWCVCSNLEIAKYDKAKLFVSFRWCIKFTFPTVLMFLPRFSTRSLLKESYALSVEKIGRYLLLKQVLFQYFGFATNSEITKHQNLFKETHSVFSFNEIQR